MSKANVFASDLLKLIFNNTAITTIGDAGGLLPSASPGSLYVSLHTAAPDETGTQTTNETAYTNYNRVAVARSGAGWTVAGSNPDPASVSPTADIDFPECGATPGSPITHFGIGAEAHPTAGKLLYWGTVTPNITMATGVIPRIKTTSTITED